MLTDRLLKVEFMKKSRLVWFVIAALFASAFAAAKLNADTLFVDEYWSIRNSGGIFGPLDMMGIWERTATIDPGGMGILYYWLLGAWEWLVGNSPFSIRAFSLLAGVLALAMVYQLGRKLFSERIGFYAALVVASSAFFIDFMHEGRAYTMLVFVSAFAVYSYFDVMQEKPVSDFTNPRNRGEQEKPVSWWAYLRLALALAALAYTHYVSLAIGAVLGLIHLFHFKNTRHWYMVVLAMLLGGALFLPWLSITMDVIQRGTEDTNRQKTSMTSWQIIENLFHSFSNANLALFFFLAFYSLKQFSKKVLYVWIYFLLSLVLVILVNSRVPFMVHTRYLIFVWPALALIMALGLEKLQRFAVTALLCWMLLGFYQAWGSDFASNLFGFIYRAPAEGFHLALDTLNDRAEEGDMALFHTIPPSYEPFNYFPLAYYLEFPPLERLHLAYDQFERMGISTAGGDNEYLVDVNRVLEPIEAVWTLRVPELAITQRTGVVNYVLSTEFLHCETVFARDDMLMDLYLRPVAGSPLGSFAEDSLRLFDMGRGYQNERVSHWVLAWETETLPNDTYSVGLHLFDAAGNFVGQTDFPLPNTRPFSCVGASIPLDTLASGTYQLRAIVYKWQSGERLASADGDFVVIGTIAIP
jgi:hypothetical protein